MWKTIWKYNFGFLPHALVDHTYKLFRNQSIFPLAFYAQHNISPPVIIPSWGRYTGVSVGLVERPLLAVIFNFHRDFDQRFGDYHVTTLRLFQMSLISGNLASYMPRKFDLTAPKS